MHRCYGRSEFLAVLLLATVVPSFSLLTAAPEPVKEPDSAIAWLKHASELTDIRMPGSPPFHMKVTFHAYAGMDFAKSGKSTIITGDGTYEETWLSPERWRREITFTGYHAVEVRANGARRYQADSDYEPSRVLMMLDALLYPVPRNLISPEFSESHDDWKIEHLAAGTLAYVALTHRDRGLNNDWFYYSYDFLPSGILVRSSYLGLVTSWSGDTVFGARVVPQHFEIQAMGRSLLTADVEISQAVESDPKLFEMAGPPASPGMTMRPFHMFEIKVAELVDPISIYTGPAPRGVTREIVDRQGRVRETELIDAPVPANNENEIKSDRSKRFYPAKVDGDPCEETFWLRG
ncbi:MAG TPA: hypothetical protein VME68_10490 [Acidobacteriaceae bacterium]|nr:hypothetical protein [Acidobacteriaceae bacterium]